MKSCLWKVRTENGLSHQLPSVYGELTEHLPQIEACFRDVMEVEFVTNQDGRL